MFCKEATRFGFYSSVLLFYVSVCHRFTYIAYTNCSVKASSSINRVHNPVYLAGEVYIGREGLTGSGKNERMKSNLLHKIEACRRGFLTTAVQLILK